MTVRVLPPMDRATLAPASAVPVIATDCSVALTMSSPATFEMVGAFGTTVSTVMARVTEDEAFPAASMALADSVSRPWPMPVMSAAVSA